MAVALRLANAHAREDPAAVANARDDAAAVTGDAARRRQGMKLVHFVG
jgi:hypothetical protein